jgi:DNA-binding NarL/FixJ family response regulator
LAKDTISVCVVEYNPLAACKLTQALQACRSIRILPDKYVLASPEMIKEGVSVFVLNSGTFRASLSSVLRSLKLRFPNAKTIVVDEERSREEICRLLLLGVHGFVPYHQVERCLKSAVRKVSRGHLWVPEEVLEQYVAYSTKLSCLRLKQESEITRRERQIIELVQRRFSNKEISSILRISESTVKFHLSNIFEKVGVHDRDDLAEVLTFGFALEPT